MQAVLAVIILAFSALFIYAFHQHRKIGIEHLYEIHGIKRKSKWPTGHGKALDLAHQIFGSLVDSLLFFIPLFPFPNYFCDRYPIINPEVCKRRGFYTRLIFGLFGALLLFAAILELLGLNEPIE